MPPPTESPTLVLYAPGLNGLIGSNSVESVAQRLARTLDHQNTDAGLVYKVRAAASEPVGDGKKLFTEVREVVRETPGKPGVVTHRVYGLDFGSIFQPPVSGNIFAQAWQSGSLLVRTGWLFVAHAVTADSLTRREKTAVIVAAIYLMVITAFFALAVATVIVAVANSLGAEDHAKAVSLTSSTLGDWFKAYYPRLIAITAVMGLSFAGVRAWLEGTVRIFVGFNRYIDSGAGRAAAVGRFNNLLEHIVERDPTGTSRIDVIAYSMGSIVTLDALFPSNGELSPRAGRISTLTTIGCPFDFVRTFWPEYYKHRTLPDPLPRWINVYSPVDVLSSNFSNDEPTASAGSSVGINGPAPSRGEEQTVNAAGHGVAMAAPNHNLIYDHAGRRELSLVGAFVLSGYLAHAQYWVADEKEAAESCYNVFVPKIEPPAPAR